MTDYSQSGEQLVILKAVGLDRATAAREPGTFLDIGAYHPTMFSNTRALYELGWSGIMVEAAPGPMRTLLAEYGEEDRIKLIQAAAATETGLVELRMSDDALSTSTHENYDTWSKAGAKFLGRVLVPGITLADIFNRYGGDFDFVNIDVEGTSADLFIDMLKLGPRPRCCCVEFDQRLPEIMTRAGDAGYTAKVIGGNVVLWL